MEDKNKILRSALLEEEEIDEINDVKTTDFALKKARLYAKNIKKVLGQDYECYFYPIAPKDSTDRVIRDIYFPKQGTADSSVRVSTDNITEASKIIFKMGYKVLGWGHGSFGVFHSPVDNKNIENVLNKISPTNYIEIPNEKD